LNLTKLTVPGPLLGYYAFQMAQPEGDQIMTIKLSTGFRRAFGLFVPQGLTVLSKAAGLVYTMQGIPNIENVRQSSIGLLYCDIVETSAMGKELVPLLASVPLNPYLRRQDKFIGDLWLPQHMLYHKVVNRAFSSINFKLMQPNGTEHQLDMVDPLDNGIAITLAFRPVPRRGTTMQRLEY
jgi:hypothetical protein